MLVSAPNKRHSLLRNYVNLFSQVPHELGQCDLVEHTIIDTVDAKPVGQPPILLAIQEEACAHGQKTTIERQQQG